MRLRVSKAYLVCTALLLGGCRKTDERPSNFDALSSESAASSTQSQAPSNLKPSKRIRHSATSITEESLPSKQQEFLKEIEGIIGRPVIDLTSEEWQAIKQYYWTPTLDQIIPQTNGLTSQLVISNMLAPEVGKEPLIAQVATGKFTNILDPAEQDFLVATHLLAMTTAGQGGASLPDAIFDRCDDPQITRGDLFIFEVLSDAFVDVSNRKQLSQSSKEKWQQLTTSPNRLYRLLALRTFRCAQPGPREWLAFYRYYLNETDPEIFREATSLVSQTSFLEAGSVLLEFRDRCAKSSESAFIDDLDLSIEWLKRQPSLDVLTK